MKPMLIAGLIVLALLLSLAVLGLVLVRLRKINVRSAALYCRASTLLVLAGAYTLNQADWVGLQLRQLDFWSMLVILGISGYAFIWATIAYQLNRVRGNTFEESFMLSMLQSDDKRGWPDTTLDPSRRKKD